MGSKLYFYHSVMNSGKSAHIIMQAFNLQQQEKKVLILKPKFDTRDFGYIKSRALDTQMDCILIDEETDIFQMMAKEKPDYIFVDEVNFLSPAIVEELADIVDELDIPVFVYGLLIDFKGQQFEGSKRLIELADSIRELKSPCVKCERKATLHLRKVNDVYEFEGESCQVGDIDTYESVCRSCYKAIRKAHQN